MSLPAQDNFDRGSLGANWTSVDGSPTISSNEASGGDVNSNIAYWNADTFADAQYSLIFNADGSAANGGPATRLASLRGYLLIGTLANVNLYRIDSNENFTLLQNIAGTVVADGTSLKLESNGSTHKCYINGSQSGTDQAEGTYASGSAGWFIFGLGARLDDWEGGNLSSSTDLAPGVGALALAGVAASMNYTLNMPDEE